ncbi:unnamed protein product [Cuscuta epithymum]|uniref:Uncharacterized protein n=1 Tax=Cuscuta epithymum TaxID=186058 RepID=A0AAV0D7F0_9ASTE|nr:unnamed protein product [Cuscuta epithymum]CAH9148865.1 unnamed protein product [Cuscuta epithymum]
MAVVLTVDNDLVLMGADLRCPYFLLVVDISGSRSCRSQPETITGGSWWPAAGRGARPEVSPHDLGRHCGALVLRPCLRNPRFLILLLLYLFILFFQNSFLQFELHLVGP